MHYGAQFLDGDSELNSSTQSFQILKHIGFSVIVIVNCFHLSTTTVQCQELMTTQDY